ncbi:MAG: rhodanese-like domain-containing protein [Desulfamplus sp.]|nr:rhodanese-like domain-containing protein [Desulfamplus sp.]
MNLFKNRFLSIIIIGLATLIFTSCVSQQVKTGAATTPVKTTSGASVKNSDPELSLMVSDEAEWRASEAKMMAAEWRFHNIVDTEFVKKYVTIPPAQGVTIIDSRPYLPKFIKGHIPTSINIPETKFNDMAKLIPSDKNTLLIFYCGGFECKLSHKAAKMAQSLGYKNVNVFAAGFPGWVRDKNNYPSVSLEYIQQEIDDNKMLLVDSRPKKAKFDKGHIPTAISLPDADFEKLNGKLPKDMDNLLVFYCEGLECKLSHQSAKKAIALGYKNVKVFSDGYPAWKKAFGEKAQELPQAKASKDEGVLNIEEFKKILEEKPDSIMLIDTRDADEFKQGHFKTAINMNIDKLEKSVKELPADKMIVFVCSTGARSGEAYYMIQDVRPELKNVWYVDAGIKFNKDGSFTIAKPK